MTKGSIQKEDITIINTYAPNRGFPRGLESKEPTCQCRRRRRLGFHPWPGRFLAEGMATHSSILAWMIPWAEEPGGLQSAG